VHSFTHVDAPRHILADGFTTSDITLDHITGRAVIIDLAGIAAKTEITDATLRSASGSIERGDMVLVKTCWDDTMSIQLPEFWKEAPYMTREASKWLLEQGVKAVGFDFPQDYPIRGLLDGRVSEMHEMVTHDILLRNGVILIEYLCNLRSLVSDLAEVVALPLKLPDSDGAPARVIARSLNR
jgi:arylformamidase